MQILTIGHSNHPIERFIELLKRNGVTALADVRSSPYSRFAPHFSRKELERSLRENGIRYVFLGRELGARSEDRSCYRNGRVVYGRLAASESFKSGLDRLLTGAREHQIALMCAEKEPLECHRTLLVAKVLDEQGVQMGHILSDGTVEDHAHAMDRLLGLTGLPKEDLFRSRAELIAEALARQEEKVAYQDEAMAQEEAKEAS